MGLVKINKFAIQSVKRIYKNKNKIKKRVFLKNDISKYKVNFSNNCSSNLFFFNFNKKFSFFFFKSNGSSINSCNIAICNFNKDMFTLVNNFVYLFYKNFFF